MSQQDRRLVYESSRRPVAVIRATDVASAGIRSMPTDTGMWYAIRTYVTMGLTDPRPREPSCVRGTLMAQATPPK